MGLGRARLPGRFQVFRDKVTWILDVAHNRAATLALADNLREFGCTGKVRAVFGVLTDQHPESMVVPLTSLVETWYLSASEDAGAMPVQQLAQRIQSVLPDFGSEVHPTVGAALDAALGASVADDCLLAFGSFATVSEALTHRGE